MDVLVDRGGSGGPLYLRGQSGFEPETLTLVCEAKLRGGVPLEIAESKLTLQKDVLASQGYHDVVVEDECWCLGCTWRL